jgi:hypothetical protein
MKWILNLAALAVLAAVCACSPSLNWREIRLEGSALVALMPCKPDRVSRTIPFVGGATRTLTMLSCEADGATFAITMADMGDAGLAEASLKQWDTVTREHVKVGSIVEQAMAPAGATPNAHAKVVVGRGTHPNGQAMQVHMAYFAKGAQIFQAVLYAPVSMKADAVEVFLTGLKLQ